MQAHILEKQAMRFSKYHGLGNDYLVIDEMGLMESPERIRVICDRNFGIGSDGILFGPLPSKSALACLRIFNPDGSEAEKSGNGIRIFCRHLWERGSVGGEPFLLETAGGIVRCRVRDPHHEIDVEMGTVSFWSDVILVMGERREVLDEELDIDGESLRISAATSSAALMRELLFGKRFTNSSAAASFVDGFVARLIADSASASVS